MYSAIQIANFFIDKHLEDKQHGIDLIKLQKIVYISYGWYWALLQKKLFKDEIQAWKYGPVIPNVWHAFKHQGDEIKKPLAEEQKPLDKDTEKVLDTVYKAYINQDSVDLVKITHAPGTPWYSVWDGTRDKKIPDVTIWRYYELLHAKLKNI